MKLTIISDTHNQHEKLGELSGDVLIHCGDAFDLFAPVGNEIEKLDEWFGKQSFDLILITGGNHDLSLEHRLQSTRQPFKNAVFLQDSECKHEGTTFYGAPWTPELRGHAFYQNESGLRDAWSQVPEKTDVLITHTPPAGILDISSQGLHLGCKLLAEAVDRISPKLHCFGHVHASAGICELNDTRFVNASSVNSQFKIEHQPKQLEI